MRAGNTSVRWTVVMLFLCTSVARAGGPQSPASGFAKQMLATTGLDPATFRQWTDGAEAPLAVADGPRHVIWTRDSTPQWDGVRFGESKKPGIRYLRIGFTQPVKIGAILVRGGGVLSVLKSDVAYAGKLNDDSQWIAAQRIVETSVTSDAVGREDYALWILPTGTSTRALRFAHTAALTDREYAGWLGGVYILPDRVANIAPFATVLAASNAEKADRIVNGSNDNMWQAWDNGKDGTTVAVSPEHPEIITLVWGKPVSLCGLNALWAGFSAGDVQTYVGPADRHPREAAEENWQTIASFDGLENQYPRTLGVNWIAFERTVTTKALRIRVTRATTEGHPHLKNNTREGKRIWLGELLALSPLGTGEQSAVIPAVPPVDGGHPPVAIGFTLKEPGIVTLVIDDAKGQRVRNLIAEKPFPAGDNVAWWDGQDDLGRDTEAARHGIYHIPGKFVPPGEYHVRGLMHKVIDLRYEFSVYNGGQPAWETADSTGAWLTNHTPPSSALYVPAERSPNGKAMVYLGSYVAEGGHGLAWFDLNGKKQGGRGWVGGAWTGAPYLARDAGPDADRATYVYVGSAWEKDLRLTALGSKGDRTVAKYVFESKEEAALSGLAVHNNLLVCSLPKRKLLLFVDAKAGTVLGSAEMDDPRGLSFDATGRLLVLTGKQLQRYVLPPIAQTTRLPAAQVVISEGLEDPQHVALDPAGNLYISDRGQSHQVKVFAHDGKPLRVIGHAGTPKAGPYDPLHMNHPNGITIDAENHLWVAETDFQPKRVSVWTLDGQFVKAFYGPSEYGGGGTIDPRDKTKFYYHGMEFKLDWEKGSDRLVSVIYRPATGDLATPEGFGVGGQPETPVYIKDHRYWSNWNNSNPTNGASIAMLWIDRNGIAVPVAAMGRASDWKLLREERFKSRWPSTDARGEYWKNPAMFLWCDSNGDGQAQPEEVTMIAASAGGMTVMDDLSFICARVNDRVMRFPVKRFTEKDVPVYAIEAGEVLLNGSQSPTSSGGDQALLTANGWTLLSVAPKPFAPQSLGGAYKGVPMWSYPSPWPGLHASHESPAPTESGQIIGTTRVVGNCVTPRGGDAGPLWCINGNQGNMYLFTADGLFIAELFKDIRVGRSWSMPIAERGMRLNDVSLHDENFWPTMTQTDDGNVYLVDGGRTSVVRIDGLDTIRRLPAQTLKLTDADLRLAQTWMIQREEERQKARGQETLVVRMRTAAPKVDGKLNDWAGAQWVSVDKRGVAAFFDSKSKPYDVSAAMTVAGDRLYVAWRDAGVDLLRNSGDTPNAPFKTGGALDVMLGVDSAADPKRSGCVAGDQRLLVTVVKNRPLALLYRAVVPGTKEPVPFSSPWRTISIDRVDDVTAQVQMAGAEGDYEASIPLSVFGLKPVAGTSIRGDIGVLRGNGFQTLQRIYWNNKATGITADVPSEAELTPRLWGTLRFEQAP